MLNKKAAIPANAIRGIIFYSFVAIIGILIFYGCNIQKAKEAYAEVKVATEEFNAIEDFNRFFEMPLNQEMRIIEIIEQSYFNNDYDKLDETARDYFSSKNYGWKFTIIDDKGYQIHKLSRLDTGYDTFVSGIEEEIARSDHKGEFKKIKIMFQILK